MTTLWIKDGALVLSGGAAVLCADCPCDTETVNCCGTIPTVLELVIADLTGTFCDSGTFTLTGNDCTWNVNTTPSGVSCVLVQTESEGVCYLGLLMQALGGDIYWEASVGASPAFPGALPATLDLVSNASSCDTVPATILIQVP